MHKHPRRNARYYYCIHTARNDKILRSRNKKKTDTLQVIKDNQQLSSQSFRSIIRFPSKNPFFSQLENSRGGGLVPPLASNVFLAGARMVAEGNEAPQAVRRAESTVLLGMKLHVCTRSTRHVDYIIDARPARMPSEEKLTGGHLCGRCNFHLDFRANVYLYVLRIVAFLFDEREFLNLREKYVCIDFRFPWI